MGDTEHDISWAMELLDRGNYEQNFIAKNWSYFCAPLVALTAPISINLWLRRPLWSGFQRYLLWGGFGVGVAYVLTEREKFALARKDAIMRDYIRLHPEDFPPPDRKKFKDLFEKWVPVR